MSSLIPRRISIACALLIGVGGITAGAGEPGIAVDSAIDVAGLDRSIAPGDDFFRYANGGWLKSAEIPADRSSYGVDEKLAEEGSRRTEELIRNASSVHPAAGSDARKVADFYETFMDEATIEKRGLAPLAPLLARIDRIRDRHALAVFLGSTLQADVDLLNDTNKMSTDNLLGLWVAQDLDDASRYSAFLAQGGLGMPDREYYLGATPAMKANQDQYRRHIGAMLALAGRAVPAERVERIYGLERRMAESHSSREESNDVHRSDNHWSRADFPRLAPGLDWSAYFAAAGLAGERRFVVWHPRAVSGVAALAASEPLEVWRDYLVLHALDHYGGLLPAAFVDERFAFFGKTLSGAQVLRERWKRGVTLTSAELGDAVGKLYAERWFSPAEKRRAEAMVHNLILAFGERIEHLEWMAPQTRARAMEKLATLRVGVGYPGHWRDYSGLRVVRGDALGNFMRAEAFNSAWHRAKLGRPVDRSEWAMTAQTVNAVNLPALNALNFPAAILQPPYFDPQRPVAMDYGAIGAVIGHEISHSFDDQGALFDARGELRNWWQPEDFVHFQQSGARLVAQYSAYRPFPDLAVNGKQTLSENIADVAGLAVAYAAFEHSRERAAAPTVAGFTPEQQFFIAFAQSWRGKMREPALREAILADSHSPNEYRVDTVRNVDEWYAAFDVKPGAALYLAPQERVRVW